MPCPYCSEPIQASSKKCRFCNEWLEKAQGRAGTLYSGSADARATAKGIKKFQFEKQVVKSSSGVAAIIGVSAFMWIDANWNTEAANYFAVVFVVLVLIVGWFVSRWYMSE